MEWKSQKHIVNEPNGHTRWKKKNDWCIKEWQEMKNLGMEKKNTVQIWVEKETLDLRLLCVFVCVSMDNKLASATVLQNKKKIK